MRTGLIGPALALLMILTACGDSTARESDELHIVATTSIWGDVVTQIVGDDATVEVLIPRGADAHDYAPTSQEVAALLHADLVVANGLGLEGGLGDILESASADGANILEVGPELDPMPIGGHGSPDPHVWFDPARVDTAVGLISERLAAVDNSVDWENQASAYSADLLQIDEEIVRTLDAVPAEDRELVTNHQALGYFADRYGFEVIAVVIAGGSTLSDPSSAELAALVSEIERAGITTIFAETTQPTRIARAVADEVGETVTVVELYTESLGEPGSEADTLTGMLLTNARLIADALGG